MFFDLVRCHQFGLSGFILLADTEIQDKYLCHKGNGFRFHFDDRAFTIS